MSQKWYFDYTLITGDIVDSPGALMTIHYPEFLFSGLLN